MADRNDDSDIERSSREGDLLYPRKNAKGFYPLVSSSPIQFREEKERRIFPWLVPVFVVANIVVFIVVMYENNCPDHINPQHRCVLRWLGRFSFQPLSENPLVGPSSATLQRLGGLETSLVTTRGQGWRLMSCVWLHAGVIHILVNMVALIFIGLQLEREFGAFRIGLLYLISGLGGSLLSALFLTNEIAVGASGALFGLLGASLSEILTNWTIYKRKCGALCTLIILVAVNLALGLLPHVDNFAHIGGFLSGLLLGFVLLMKPQYGWMSRKELPLGNEIELPVKHRHKTYQYVLLVSSALLLVAGFTGAFVALYTGVDANKKCSWCHYLSCVPTAAWHCDYIPSGGN
jgi:membrane associated rhomboid family serine protease